MHNSGQLSLSDDLKIKKKYWSIKKILKITLELKKWKKLKEKRKRKKICLNRIIRNE